MTKGVTQEPSTFWKRLTETYGRKHPMGQTAVAKAFQAKNQSTAQRWYNGTALPSWETLLAMADAGETTLEYLVAGRRPRHRIRLVGDLLRLAQIWEALSVEGRKVIMEAAESRLTLEAYREEVTGKHHTLTPDEIARLLNK